MNLNKKAFELAMGWVIGIAIVLVVLMVIFVVWKIVYGTIAGLPG